MTNQAIIIINPNKNKDFLFKELNGKMFLHYQLSYLAENLFEKIIIIDTNEAPSVKMLFGNRYLDMEVSYINPKSDITETELLKLAFEEISDIYAFIFDAHHLFRLNLAKADDFRRMRDSKMLHIGSKAEGEEFEELPNLIINEKGRIVEIQEKYDVKKADTYFTNCWLISKKYFLNQYATTKTSLFDIIKSNYLEYRIFCLACRQYFTTVNFESDLEIVENEIREYHYQ